MKRKSLYVCYVRLYSDLFSSSKPIYCYAFSRCHAMNLAIKHCVNELNWSLNTFHVSDPFLLINFVR